MFENLYIFAAVSTIWSNNDNDKINNNNNNNNKYVMIILYKYSAISISNQ